MTNTNQKPLVTLRDGRISASVFANQSEKGSFYSVVFQRLYTDPEGNVKNANNFSGVELLKLSRLAAHVYDEIRRQMGDSPTRADVGD